MGGGPNWLSDEETPATYAQKVPMVFLMQLVPGFAFETTEHAPKQVELGLDGKPKSSARAHYELFLSNALYLYGTQDDALRLVYAITQVE
jgi:hypothetical protein